MPIDVERQDEPPIQPPVVLDSDEYQGYGDAPTQIWKLYGIESEKRDKTLVENWKSSADSMLIFTGLFSSIVASFLIETYKTLLADTGSQTVSLLTQLVVRSDGTARASSPSIAQQGVTPLAIPINVLMFLSLFFSVSSAAGLDSHTTMGSRISAILTAKCGTAQAWPNACLSP